MMADGPIVDGVIIWWDMLGLSADLRHQRGAFAPAASPDPARFPLATAFAGQTDLPEGWFSRFRCSGDADPPAISSGGAGRHAIRIEMTELAAGTGKNSRGPRCHFPYTCSLMELYIF